MNSNFYYIVMRIYITIGNCLNKGLIKNYQIKHQYINHNK